jgi:hypothetical protein
MNEFWYSVCIPCRVFLVVTAYLSLFSNFYLVLCGGFVLSFFIERKFSKAYHAIAYGCAYFGGIVAVVFLTVDLTMSLLENTKNPCTKDPQDVAADAVVDVDDVVDVQGIVVGVVDNENAIATT